VTYAEKLLKLCCKWWKLYDGTSTDLTLMGGSALCHPAIFVPCLFVPLLLLRITCLVLILFLKSPAIDDYTQFIITCSPVVTMSLFLHIFIRLHCHINPILLLIFACRVSYFKVVLSSFWHMTILLDHIMGLARLSVSLLVCLFFHHVIYLLVSQEINGINKKPKWH